MSKKNKKFYITVAIMLLVAFYFMYRSPKSTGSEYAPDMGHSKSYETYDEGPIATLFGNVKEYMSALLPVNGTIPRNGLPSEDVYRKEPSVIYSYRYTQFYKDNDIDKARAGVELKNPYEPTAEVLKRGEVVYQNQCAVCHGKTGMGDGPLVVREDGTEPAYKAVPPTFADRLATLKDGEIYHSIVYGKNMMGGYGPHVKADDRWKLICFIKELGGLNSKKVDSASVPIAKKDSVK
jgi:mono/diheme cytochrome c family protein